MLYVMVAVFLVATSVTQALPCCDLVGPGAPGVVLRGPSGHASVLGPDGSVISGSAIGGVVVAPPLHGGVVKAGIAPGVVGIHSLGHGLAYGLGHGIW